MDGRGRAKAAEDGRGSYMLGLASALIGGGLMGGLLYRLPPSSTVLARPDVHAEYAKYASAGGATITGHLAYPERKDRAPRVGVIHAIFGLADGVRQPTEHFAHE